MIVFTTGFLTIGLPTTRRPIATYIYDTLKSLVLNSTENDKNDTTIVIFLADRNATYAAELVRNVSMWFPKYLENGFIQVIRAPDAYYPPLRALKRTYGDSTERVKWRSKQNLDYAFLMHYSQPLSEYYMQLEDDVIAARDYLGRIKSYIRQLNGRYATWTMAEFSRFGFIGKLYHSTDIGKLAYLLRVFFNEQPCDYLLRFFQKIMLQKMVLRHHPDLFMHIGYWSTLPEQIRPSSSQDDHNPPATLSTTMTIHERFTLRRVYSGQGTLWAKDVRIGDTATIAFGKPRTLKRIIIVTGYRTLKRDIAESAILEYSRTTNCTTYTQLATFDQLGRLNYATNGLEHVRCLRMKMTKSQNSWLIINRIHIR